MPKVSRNDVFVRDERGPDWFNEFLHSVANSKPSTVNDILDAITNKKGETVESVVQSYREQVGLDALSHPENDNVKTSTTNTPAKEVKASSPRPLSIRHAQEEGQSVIEIIESSPDLRSAIDSFCEHSGGTKNTHAIIRFLRDRLGKNLVSYTDEELLEYIKQRKDRFKKETKESDQIDFGLVGTDSQEAYDDNVADYATHGDK